MVESCDIADQVEDITWDETWERDDGSCAHAWTGRVISSSAFNLSMQVLRYLTFTPTGSPLLLSASDSYGVELSGVHVCVCACVCVDNALSSRTSLFLQVSSVRPCVCAVQC